MDKERTVIKHLMQQPFVAATGVAALVHSTWSLGTFFSGVQPDSTFHLIGWLIPALLIAFSLDVGQIVTSHEIRESGLTVARGITFTVFALATYYLQWLYMAHHMPQLPLSSGISIHMQEAALALRDMAIWIIPALMPASTLLYTFSSDRQNAVTTDAQQREQTEPLELGDLIERQGNPQEMRQCDHCGATFRTRNKQKRFCSPSCRVSNARKKLTMHTGVSNEAEGEAL